jgi:hypothetical protein
MTSFVDWFYIMLALFNAFKLKLSWISFIISNDLSTIWTIIFQEGQKIKANIGVHIITNFLCQSTYVNIFFSKNVPFL